MNNKEFHLHLIENTSGVEIETLVWIAAAGKEEVDDLFFDIEYTNIAVSLPFITQEEAELAIEDNSFSDLFYDKGLYGFLAEVHLPECNNFRFNDACRPIYWSVNKGISQVNLVYAETIEDLQQEILKAWDRHFLQCQENEKNKKKKASGKKK